MLIVIHWANSWLPSLLAYLATTASHRNTRQFNPSTPMSDQLHISPCMQPHQKYNITQSGELMAFHSLLGWKMIVIPILTTSCEGQNEVFMKCIMLFSLNILVSRLLCTFTGWPHKLHPGQRTLSWETITIFTPETPRKCECAPFQGLSPPWNSLLETPFVVTCVL